MSAGAGSTSRSRGRNRSAGRVHINERDYDDTIPIVGGNIEVEDVDGTLSDAIHATISMGMSEGTRRNYRNRIAKIIAHWKDKFPTYYDVGVCSVTEEHRNDRTKYFFNKTEDIVYEGMNVKYVIGFLASTDKRGDGKLKSFDDLRKYRDAVLWGAKISGALLPSTFYTETEQYLAAYKKKVAIEKKKVMWKSMVQTPFRCLSTSCCCVDQLKQTTYSHGRGPCCSGTAWRGVHP